MNELYEEINRVIVEAASKIPMPSTPPIKKSKDGISIGDVTANFEKIIRVTVKKKAGGFKDEQTIESENDLEDAAWMVAEIFTNGGYDYIKHFKSFHFLAASRDESTDAVESEFEELVRAMVAKEVANILSKETGIKVKYNFDKEIKSYWKSLVAAIKEYGYENRF